MSYTYIKNWRKNNKLRLIQGFGGKCAICNLDDDISIYDFHHLDPKEKDFVITTTCRSWQKTVNEVKKCALVCSNCHRKLHSGKVVLPENFKRFDENLALINTTKVKLDHCPICGKEKNISQITCSKTCAAKKRIKVNWNNYDLKSLYDQIGSFLGVANFIGNISDVSVKKRMKKMNLL